MSKQVLETVCEKFRASVLDSHSQCGDETVIIEAAALRDLMLYLRDDPEMAFEMLIDVTVVDYLPREPRFEVVYHLLSLQKRHRLRVKVPIAESVCEVESLWDVYGSAEWGEREAWDMYGVRFTNHPDLRRLLMYEEFEGHPLRKDYGLQAAQPRIDLLAEERPTTNMYNPNFGEYGPEKENR